MEAVKQRCHGPPEKMTGTKPHRGEATQEDLYVGGTEWERRPPHPHTKQPPECVGAESRAHLISLSRQSQRGGVLAPAKDTKRITDPWVQDIRRDQIQVCGLVLGAP